MQGKWKQEAHSAIKLHKHCFWLCWDSPINRPTCLLTYSLLLHTVPPLTLSSKTASLTHLVFSTIRENISENKTVLTQFWDLKFLLSPAAQATAPSKGDYSNMLRSLGRFVCMMCGLQKGWFICDSQSPGDSTLRRHQRHKLFMETLSHIMLTHCKLAVIWKFFHFVFCST